MTDSDIHTMGCVCPGTPENCATCEECKEWRIRAKDDPSVSRCIFLAFYPPNPWQADAHKLERAGVSLFYSLYYSPADFLRSLPLPVVMAYTQMQRFILPRKDGSDT